MNWLNSLERSKRSMRDRILLAPWMPGRPDILEPQEYADRRVIVIGPAETLADDLNGTEVDEFDVVVRLNNGISLAASRPELFGQRTDLLFHNLRETGHRSAGEIPGEFLMRHGVDTVVFPHWGRKQYWKKRASLQREGGPPLKILPIEMMQGLREDLSDRKPTIGLCAIMFFLASPVSELAIHGFTFFETRYAPGYNDAIRTAGDAQTWVDARGAHDPLSEKNLLRARLAKPDIPLVTLGRNTRRYLEAGPAI
ncbi:hypothetical protein ACFSUD_15495 [Sulfitobacter aestuarii]|uniref:Glycosyltransferase family 29 (Sialyltransferase) n=1 Tax=Sulfitobacter aestuarii TaxID=2161676 RepID=A0ABW5U582_9RHOB